MNTNYLESAKERIPSIPLLINVISRRVKQINQGQRPLVKPDSLSMPPMDIALKEVAEGKLTAEMAFTAVDEEVTADERFISL
ncbi:MAG: DNA-directed RNA polymerase subunit omega [Spartobacteria bacterium]|nr:DNA-directed RNA polymerase subunit omega [Spartobacteria bacterium]